MYIRYMDNKYLSIKQVAERLGVNKKTVRRWITNGQLNACRAGIQWRITEEDLQSFLNSPAKLEKKINK